MANSGQTESDRPLRSDRRLRSAGLSGGLGRVRTLVAVLLVLSGLVVASAAIAAGHHHPHHHHKRQHRAHFVLSGGLARPLGLGRRGASPLNLAIRNRSGKRLILFNIRVYVARVKAAPGAHGACAQRGPHSPNFAITNLPARYRVIVPPHATRSLVTLGRHWEPLVTWLDQPWAQNGCLGSRLSFAYHAKARPAKQHRHPRRHGRRRHGRRHG